MHLSNPHTYRQMARAIEHLTAHAPTQLPLGDVAAHANLSEFHFQRLFTEWAGVSPKKFSQFLTLDYAKRQLRAGQPLTETAEQAGLSGTSRLHDLFVTLEGVTPGQFKQAGHGLTLQYGVFDSPFGPYVLGAIGGRITVLHFLREDELPTAALSHAWPNARLDHQPDAVQPLAALIFPALHETTYPPQPLPVLLRGSAFQLKVWEALLRIPEGALASYDQIARQMGQPTASRAVGTAIGQNPVGYLIPCHRVIKKTGLFGGYRWGIERKQLMLGWEAARMNA